MPSETASELDQWLEDLKVLELTEYAAKSIVQLFQELPGIEVPARYLKLVRQAPELAERVRADPAVDFTYYKEPLQFRRDESLDEYDEELGF